MSASDGARSRSLHESPALTPPFLPAPGRWFACGEILPVLSSNCCEFAVTQPAGPMTPAVPCAVTSLPDAADELCLTGAGALGAVLLPPAPPQPPPTPDLEQPGQNPRGDRSLYQHANPVFGTFHASWAIGHRVSSL